MLLPFVLQTGVMPGGGFKPKSRESRETKKCLKKEREGETLSGGGGGEM